MTSGTISSSSLDEKPKNFARRVTLTGVIWISIIFGILVSGYLTYVKATETPMVCVVNGIFDCHTVQNSAYARFLGVPIAYFGFAMYLALAAILFFERRSPLLAQYSKILMFGISLFGWMFSMWLVYVQVALLGALCPWCLSHEANMTILFPLLCLRLWRDMQGEAS